VNSNLYIVLDTTVRIPWRTVFSSCSYSTLSSLAFAVHHVETTALNRVVQFEQRQMTNRCDNALLLTSEKRCRMLLSLRIRIMHNGSRRPSFSTCLHIRAKSVGISATRVWVLKWDNARTSSRKLCLRLKWIARGCYLLQNTTQAFLTQ
jgi:hypothetical protein